VFKSFQLEILGSMVATLGCWTAIDGLDSEVLLHNDLVQVRSHLVMVTPPWLCHNQCSSVPV